VPSLIAAVFAAALLPQNATPAAPVTPSAPPSVDPAAVTFSTDVGLLLVLIKPDKTADYESALTMLQAALAKDTDPARRAMSQGWRVYKAAEADAKGNVVYVHALLPAVGGGDYRPSMLLDKLLDEVPADLLTKYRDAFAAAPSKLSLTEFANMAVAPVKK
jgi:hypothetical protein